MHFIEERGECVAPPVVIAPNQDDPSAKALPVFLDLLNTTQREIAQVVNNVSWRNHRVPASNERFIHLRD
jgi:hypothetical protein